MEWLIFGGLGFSSAALGAAVRNETQVLFWLLCPVVLWFAASRRAISVSIDADRRIVSVRRQSLLTYKFEVFDFDRLSAPFAVNYMYQFVALENKASKSSSNKSPEPPIPQLLMNIDGCEAIVLGEPRWFGERETAPQLNDIAAAFNRAIPKFAANEEVETLPVH